MKQIATLCLVALLAACSAKQPPAVSQQDWGTADGAPVYLYTLTNSNGMVAKITNYGAIVTELYAPDREGRMDNVVLGLDSLASYQKGHPCFGATVGRYINRIGGARFTLDGVEYQLAKNSNGRHNIHGGRRNFYTQVWEGTTSTTRDAASVSLSYLSKDMEEGFPGNLQVTADYALTNDNELRITYTATTDKPTVVNLSNHSYFNLSGAQESVLDHEVRIFADEYIPTDRDQIPTGDILGVEGTPLDLRQWTRIGDRMDSLPGGFDHSFCVKGKRNAAPVLVAELRHAKSGRLLQTYTTQPGLCFFTARGLSTRNHTAHGTPYGKSWGACLETQHHPDSPNHSNFPTTVLRPGDTYREVTVYKFGVIDPMPVQEPIDMVIEHGLRVAGEHALQMAEALKEQEGRLPKTITRGRLETCSPDWWTSGFFPGELWYLYEHSGNEAFREYAELFTERLEEVQHLTNHHDVGFMLYCSYGNGYRLTRNPAYSAVLTTGARSLSTRYRDRVGLIRSWDFNTDIWQYPVIIDNMMNLELMMWAYRTTGEERFKDIAMSHADNTLQHHFRADNSCYHVVSYDTISGVPHRKQTFQGLSDESSWSRGQAWALYGFTMMYRETHKSEYLDQARRVAQFLIHHPNMPADKVPYWDYDVEVTPQTPRDASAAAVMASALVELGALCGNEEGKSYIAFAEQQLRSLTSYAYLALPGDNCHFALMHSTGSFPARSEVDVPLSYADYYYVEALLRLKNYLYLK